LITLIVAVADNGVIGRDNALPWHLPDDLKRFKRLTLGKPIVMGRKTFESIGKPLPGRHNIVVTRDANYCRAGVTVVHGIDEAVAAANGAAEIMIIGGAELFRMFLPRATRVHLTRVHAEVEGDVVWPTLDDSWRVVESEPHVADERHASPMTFEVWEKRSK
jgi:dihydrofolate reductase